MVPLIVAKAIHQDFLGAQDQWIGFGRVCKCISRQCKWVLVFLRKQKASVKDLGRVYNDSSGNLNLRISSTLIYETVVYIHTYFVTNAFGIGHHVLGEPGVPSLEYLAVSNILHDR